MSRHRVHGVRLAIAVGLAVFVVLAGTGVSSAGWNATAGTTSGSVTAATPAVTVAGSGSTTTEYKFSGAATASNSAVRTLSVTNTGSAPLSYTLQSTAVTGTLNPATVKLTVWRLTTGACTTTPATGATVGTLAAPPALPTGAGAAASGQSLTLCALTSLATTVAQSQGQSLTATLTITGRVGENWTTTGTDTSALTQSVYRVGNPGSLTCTEQNGLFNSNVTLAVTAPAGVTGLTYRVVDAANPATVIKPAQTATSFTISGADLATSPATLMVQALESVYGTTSTGVPITLTESPGLFGIGVQVNCP